MQTCKATREMWMRFFETRSEEARERLIEANLRLVHKVACRVRNRIGEGLEYDELVQAGCLGLLTAVDTYDPTLGNAFSSFAVPRIHGAILDELRKMDRSTRLSRTRKRELARAEQTIASRKYRVPRSDEVAEEMGIDVTTVHEWRLHASHPAEMSLDRPVGDDRRGTVLAEFVPSGACARIERHVVVEQEVGRLTELLMRLPDRERLVLQLYYFENLKQARIAEILGVTESRVSQIRTRTLDRLRGEMAEDTALLFQAAAGAAAFVAAGEAA